MRKRKQKEGRASGPSRGKRMKRPARLQAARIWLSKYEGLHIVAAYRKRFGVDWPCTFEELEMLGVALDPAYVQAVLTTIEGQIAAGQRQSAKNKQGQTAGLDYIEQDDDFAFIVGYTSGGAPYGLTWAEWENLDDDLPE